MLKRPQALIDTILYFILCGVNGFFVLSMILLFTRFSVLENPLGVIVLIVFFCVAVIYLVLAYGLYRGAKWAYRPSIQFAARLGLDEKLQQPEIQKIFDSYAPDSKKM